MDEKKKNKKQKATSSGWGVEAGVVDDGGDEKRLEDS